MKIRLVVLTLIGAMLPMTAAAGATELQVPAQYPTIQSAIDAAAPGDTVVVQPGSYIENLTIDKTVHVVSAFGPQSTTIQAAAPDSTVKMTLEASESPTLSGFSIAGGTALFGGGVNVFGGAPTFMNNIVSGNLACNGGGMYLQASAATVQENHIVENGPNGCTGGRGGGIYLSGEPAVGAATVTKNVIEGNLSSLVGGVAVNSAGAAVIDSNRIVTNATQSPNGVGALDVANYSPITFVNNIVDGNGGSRDVDLLIASSNPGVTVAHNTFISSPTHTEIIELSTYGSSARISSNIFTNNPTEIDCVLVASGSSVRIDHNLFSGSGPSGHCAGLGDADGNVFGGVALDPNYQISGGVGPAIDSAALDIDVPFDYSGLLRHGFPDMGALEWAGNPGDIVADAGPDITAEWAPDLLVSLDASGSSHPYGEFLYYQWNSIGSTTIAEGERAQVTFPEPGVYEVQLFAIDTSFSVAVDYVVITLSDPGPDPTPPVADAGPDLTTEVFVPVTLDGSASYTDNPDSYLVEWEWSGAFENSPVYGETVDVVFDTPGVYEVTLTVKDFFLFTDTDTVTVTVTEPIVLPPIADAGPDQTLEYSEGLVVSLDGLASSDPNGLPLSYQWEFVGGVDTGPLASFPIGAPGVYTATLTVDNGTYTDSDTVTITVLEPALPAASASLSNSGSGSKGATLFTVGAGCENASLAAAELNGVSVSDGQVVELKQKGGKERISTKGGTLRIESSSFSLVVTCIDGGGQTVTATAEPAF